MDGAEPASRPKILKYAILLAPLMLGAFAPLASAQQSGISATSTGIEIQICSLISLISSVIGILAIFLFVLGAVLYAVAQVLPAAGNLKAGTQGWGMGMLIGGIIAVVLYILSSFLIYRIAAFSNSGFIPAITQVNCSSLGAIVPSGSRVSTSLPLNSTLSALSAGLSSVVSPATAAVSGGLAAITGRNGFGAATTNLASYCQARPGPQLSNGDFSTGSYTGWNTTGTGFGTSPLDINIANENGYYYSSLWSNYRGEFFATTYSKGSLLSPGNLTSAPFQVTGPFLNFRIVSPKSVNLYVEILFNNRPFIISHYDTTFGRGSAALGTFENASFYVEPFLCQNISVRAVADVLGNSTNSGSFIAVGDFQISNSSTATQGVLLNTTIV